MSRDALVVGLNSYVDLKNLEAPAEDAEAIARRLEEGGFRVWRLPQTIEDGKPRVGRMRDLSLIELETKLGQLFNPSSKQIPETALFYFSGHGLLKDTAGIQEGYLATSDVAPAAGLWGLSLRWLRRLLEESEVRQQIIWLDCCHSGALFDFNEADPGDRGKGRDRCFIAASRDYQSAFEDISSKHSVLTQALLEGLDPRRHPGREIDNLLLTDFVNQAMRGAIQSPVCNNSGEPIRLIQTQAAHQEASASRAEPTICPYKGLAYFDCNDEDPKYFYGRTALTDQLLDKVRQGNFLAIVGASGNGKSSVLRAGLLHQLKLGRKVSGSHQWQIRIMVPGERPLQNLALAFVDSDLPALDRAEQLSRAEGLLKEGAEGLRRLVQTTDAPRVVLVVDQFEEVFTLCKDDAERQQFFATLLGAIAPLKQQICLILAMRADFFGKCVEQEYSGLAEQMRLNLTPVVPMTEAEVRDAIEQPAKQAGLAIEPELVNQLIHDVQGAPGILPLLQYTLTELWKQRNKNLLELKTYIRLGGVTGTLQKRATEVYEAFNPEQQAATRTLFLALTSLGEGTEDTRRRVFQQDLVSTKHPEAIVSEVVKKLADEKLIVTSEVTAKNSGERYAVVDVAHEALIRHWPLLRKWLEENRDLIRQQRRIEAAASEWRDRGRKGDDLWQGRTLTDAQMFQKKQVEQLPISSLATTFIREGLKKRRGDRLKLAWLLVVPAIVVGLLFESYLREEGVSRYRTMLGKNNKQEQRYGVEGLVRGCSKTLTLSVLSDYVSERLYGNCRSLSGVTLSGANLRSANLRSVDLSGADLRNADLNSAKLSSTNLHSTDFSSTNLSSADLIGANLRSANLSSANLNSAYLKSARLSNADLSSANLFNADLRNTNLAGANLNGADLRNTNLAGASLNGASLNGASLNGADLNGAELRDAKLEEALLQFTDLNGADLRDANLERAFLSMTNFDGTYLRSASFKDANLTHASFKGAYLEGNNLESASLVSVDLDGAILLTVDLRNTEELTKQQLTGKVPPLLCNVAFPKRIKLDPNRDCERLPQELVKRYSGNFKNLSAAKAYVDKARKRKWN